MTKKVKNRTKIAKPFKLSDHIADAVPFEVLLRLCDPSWEDFNHLRAKCKFRDPTVIDDLLEKPLNYQAATRSEIEEFRNTYQAQSFLKKLPLPGDEQKCSDKAQSRFDQAEYWCRMTNRRMSEVHYNCVDPSKSPRNFSGADVELIKQTRLIIKQVLGVCDIEGMLDLTANGSGTSYNPLADRNATETSEYFKLHDELSCTPAARKYVKDMVKGQYQLLQHYHASHEARSGEVGADDDRVISAHITEVAGNRVTMVPKDRNTHRSIAIEPSGNLALQKGVGEYLKDRLAPWGVNLRSQVKNQEFAREGSITGRFSTVDLAMASDTISTSVVKLLLPTDWFCFLDEIRCQTGVNQKGETIKYNKFSSMGNAFTFELESLLFFAIKLSSMKIDGMSGQPHDSIAVYGDDLAFVSRCTAPVIKALRFFGFRVNHSKSFWTGNFRESCGKDFILGKDVRPVFLRRKVETNLDLNFLANNLLVRAMLTPNELLDRAYRCIYMLIPPKSRNPIPIVHHDRDIVRYGRHEIDEITADYESGLMMPIEYASEFSCISRSKRPTNDKLPYCQDWFYTRYLRVSKKASDINEAYEHEFNYQEVRYLIFLLGHRNGDISLRDSYRLVPRTFTSSSWDRTQLEAPRTIRTLWSLTAV